jgi:hypothetical protein
MPVDPTIRRLAADRDFALTIKMIDLFFEDVARQMDSQAADTVIEGGWNMMKRGIVRLYGTDAGDDKDDDDPPLIVECTTPGQRARARVIGGKLFAMRQHLRHPAREGLK